MRSATKVRGRASRLHGAAAAWAVATALGVVYVLSTLPTPLYVIYREAFHFTRITLTLVYAAYVVGSLGAMLVFGHLSDQIGRRPVVLAFGAASVVLAVAALVFEVRRALEASGNAPSII